MDNYGGSFEENRYLRSQILDEFESSGARMSGMTYEEYVPLYQQQHPDKFHDDVTPKNVLSLERNKVEAFGAVMGPDGTISIPQGANYAPADAEHLSHMNESLRMNVLHNKYEAHKAIGNYDAVKACTQFGGNPFEFNKYLNRVETEFNPDCAEYLRATAHPKSLAYSEYTLDFLEDAAFRRGPQSDMGLINGSPMGDANKFEQKYKENPEATMAKLESTIGVVTQAYLNNPALRGTPTHQRFEEALTKAAENSEMFANLKYSVENKQLDCRETPLKCSNAASYADLHAGCCSAGVNALAATDYLQRAGIDAPHMAVQKVGLTDRLVEQENVTEKNAEAAAAMSQAYAKNKPTKTLTPSTVRAEEAAKNPTRGALGTDPTRYQQYFGNTLRDQNQHAPQQSAIASDMHSNTAEAMRAKYGSQVGNNKNSAIIQQAMQNAERVQNGPSGPSNNFQPGA